MHKLRATLAVAVTLACFTPVAAQQQPGPDGGATAAQLASAAAEVPRLLELLEVEAGMSIADVGAGFGAWTVSFSDSLGPTGRVFASDIGEQQLAALRQAVARGSLTNVTVVEGAERSTNLPPGCCDAILIRDAYHHLTQPGDFARSLGAALKPGGRLAVVDFPPRPETSVPAGVPANRLGHGVPPDVVVAEVTAAGLTHLSTITEWSPGSQPASLFLVLFQKLVR
ncbi:MAG: methyltransferase domain-containing protein [Acidobacteria bacterium]|nr:methyltransferase domain-containing protein [Acidobacteriota bacterium]